MYDKGEREVKMHKKLIIIGLALTLMSCQQNVEVSTNNI